MDRCLEVMLWFYDRMDLLEPLMEDQRMEEKTLETRNRRRVVAEEDDEDDDEVCPRGGVGRGKEIYFPVIY